MDLKSLDIISPNNYINFKGSTKHSSYFSALLSIASYLVMLVFGVYFSLDVLFKKNPTSYFYKQFMPDVGSYYFDPTSVFHYFQLLDSSDNVVFDPDYWTVIGAVTIYDFVVGKDFSELSHYLYEYCTDKDLVTYGDVATDKQFSKSLCIKRFYNATTKKVITQDDPDFVYPGMHHGTGSTVAMNMGYAAFVMRCMDLPYRTTPCKSKEEIIEKENAELFRVKLATIDNDFDVTDYKKPVVSYFLDTKNQVTGETLVNNFMNFNPVLVQTDDGFLFPSNNTRKSYRFDQNEKSEAKKSNDDRFISGWHFLIQNKAEKYERTYPKVQEALANVGGASKAITIIASIINYFVYQYIYILDIQSIFDSIGLQLKKENGELKVGMGKNTGISFGGLSKKVSFSSMGKSITPTPQNLMQKKEKQNISDTPSMTALNNTANVNNYITPLKTQNSSKRTQNQQFLRQSEEKYFRVSHISFCQYLKSFFNSKTMTAKEIKILENFWKTQVSEESMIKLNLAYIKMEKEKDQMRRAAEPTDRRASEKPC